MQDNHKEQVFDSLLEWDFAVADSRNVEYGAEQIRLCEWKAIFELIIPLKLSIYLVVPRFIS